MTETDYSKLTNALASYQDAIDLYREHQQNHATQREINTDVAAIIQNFEFTIEISWKLIQKWLAKNGFSLDSFDSKGKLFKTAFEEGLIDSAEAWQNYYRSRNLSAHTYGDEMAQKIFAIALSFYDEAKKLNEKLLQNAA